jgi:uncharacterized membrane protein YfcA
MMRVPVGWVVIFCAAAVAGAINSVAGGGTLISFPSLIAFGLGAIPANATNTAAMWPGSLSSAVAYSRDTPLHRDLIVPLVLPSVLGALLGAFALVVTPPELFDRTVPFLVLFATMLFAFRGAINRRFNLGGTDESVTAVGRAWGFVFQLFVASYGGYFGAGIGILMLGSLSIMGLKDIHRMNGLKTLLATVINVIAFVFFALKGLVVWRLAIVMAAASIAGGCLGARAAKRVNPQYIQAFVIAVGLAVSLWLFARAR